ncbi:MAG: DUF4907 domain-containing protein [Bacteroidales bacterium]
MNTIKIVSICFLLFLTACSNNTKKEEGGKDNQSKENPYAKAEIDIKTFQTDTIGWGYDIYIDGSLYIHQPHKPALPGIHGFNNEKSAQKTAELVVSKIRKNILPPTLSVGEADSITKLTISEKKNN